MKKTLMSLLAITVLGGASFAGGFENQREQSGGRFAQAVEKGASDSGNATPNWKFGKKAPTAKFTGESRYGKPKSLGAKVQSLSKSDSGERKPSLGDKVKGVAGRMRDKWNKMSTTEKVVLMGVSAVMGGICGLSGLAGVVVGGSAGVLYDEAHHRD
ncbi:MAG: hypothetical protein PHP45_09255 [Elusimicrobiales bacterium]|nr:hypothetical protein [Elusimicrobiales bacterium]